MQTWPRFGLLQRFGVLHLRLPSRRSLILGPGIAIALYLVEFCADKIPYLDTVWDAIHTFIRPPAAALLAYAAAGGARLKWRWGAALIAAASPSLRMAPKQRRAAVNATPSPSAIGY